MERHFDEGEVIVKEGDTSSEFFLLKEGEAWAYKNNKKIGILKSDEHQEFIGEVGAILGTPRNATVIAQTKCVVLAVPATSLEKVIEKAPSLGYKLCHSLAKKLYHAEKMLNLK